MVILMALGQTEVASGRIYIFHCDVATPHIATVNPLPITVGPGARATTSRAEILYRLVDRYPPPCMFPFAPHHDALPSKRKPPGAA